MPFQVKNPRSLLVKIAIIFIPVYTVAILTEKMIYILPTLAVGLLFGANLDDSSKDIDPSDDATFYFTNEV